MLAEFIKSRYVSTGGPWWSEGDWIILSALRLLTRAQERRARLPTPGSVADLHVFRVEGSFYVQVPRPN